MLDACLVVVSDPDPVARAVADRWGTPPATDWHVDGSPIRRLRPGVALLRRPGLHIHDERLDARLPSALRERAVTLVFPSIHRSEQNVPCLTVHPLGNPGLGTEVGGRPESWVPTDPRRMADALRRLAEGARPLGLRASYEATHHGPFLELPAFFIEIGFGASPGPSPESVRLLAEVVPELVPDPGDRIALGVGGGHYAPHFTDLALRRRWSFGHLVSRHALGTMTSASARAAFEASGGAEGVVYARVEDAGLPALGRLGPRLRDQDAPRREAGPATGDARPASGT